MPMRNFTLSFIISVLALLFGFEGYGQCGIEDFTNSNATASYTDGSFVGNVGITWTYVASRDENGDANSSGIDGEAIMLRRVADDSKITSSTVSGGLGDFSVKLYKGFTGAGDRQVQLYVKGVSQGTSTPFDDNNEHIFTVNDINIEGDVVIEVRNITSRQVIVDDISWTCFSAAPLDCPVLGANIGDACDDGDAVTENDVVTAACQCVGTLIPLLDEPTNHATNFTCTTLDSDEIRLNWDDATGGQIPDGYLILWSDVSYISIIDPVEGIPIDDGPNALNFSTGDQFIILTGLTQSKDYYFKIFPYTNSDGNIKYKTGVGVPQTSCTTEEGPCGGVETFSNIPTISGGSYLERTWTGDDGIEFTATNARTDQTINGKAITIRDGSLTHMGVVSGGINELTLTTKRAFSGNDGSLKVYINNIEVGLIPYSGTEQTNTLAINIPSDFTFKIDNPLGERVAIDDLTWTCYTPPMYDCPVLEANFGDFCDDGDTTTENDVVTAECDCVGTPLPPEPDNHATDFICSVVGTSQINLSWVNATGGQLPGGYLLLWSDIEYDDIPTPVDGVVVFNGPNAQNVAYGIESFEVTGLNPDTDYYFKIFPYSNSGSNIKFKTGEFVPKSSCITLDGPCISEGFNNGTIAPSGWNFSGIGDTYITTGNYGVTSPSIKFDHSNDRITTPISTSSATEVSFWLKGQSINTSSSSFLVEGFDGSNWSTIENIFPIPEAGTTYTYNSTTSPVLTPDLVQFRFTYSKSTGNLAFDDLEVLCSSETVCAPTHTITGFSPHEGPEGTNVTIIGTGFDNITDVQIGGNSISGYSIIDDTKILVPIDAILTSGLISVIVLDCEVKSADSFSYLTGNGNCSSEGGSPTGYADEIFISEVYDASSGSLSYIELFNGTENDINLGTLNYSIRIVNHGKNGGTDTNDYDLSGNLESGATHTLMIGGGASLCPGFTAQDNRPTAPGFNGDDEIMLYKGSVLLDYVPNPNHAAAGGSGGSAPGFGQARKDFVVSPSATYISNEWVISNTENCDNLGVAPYVPAGKNITINEHPTNVSCNTATFSVDATSTENAPEYIPTTYTWQYIAPGDLTWKAIYTLNGYNGLIVSGANSSSITITGNTSQLLGYQFYVDMATGGSPNCRKYSNAASYTYDTKAVYRTKASGDWSNLSIWEMSDSEAGSFVDVCQYPIDRTSDKIIIHNGHEVSLDVEIPVDQLEICESCTLILEPNMELTILNGNSVGPDFVVNGTLIDNGNQANGLRFGPLASWELGSNGTVIKTSSSYASRYREAYYSGIENIPATADWIYRYTNSGHLSFANSAIGKPMYYPNLILENMQTGIYTSNVNVSNSNLSDFTITGGELLTIKGNFEVGRVGNIRLSNLNTHADPVLVMGELIINSGSELLNSGGASNDYGTGFEVRGEMDIEGTLDLTAGTDPNQGVLKLSGTPDFIGVGDGTVMINHLIIDKGPLAEMQSELNFDVHKSGTFTEGILELEDGSFLTFHENATASGASNASFIDGKVIKVRTADEEFTFPIGNIKDATNKWYQPARIFGVSGTATIEAQYFAKANPNAGAYYDGQSNSPGDNQHIGNCDYWTITKADGDDIKLALTFTNDDHDLDDEYCNKVLAPAYMRIYSFNDSPELMYWDMVSSGNTFPSEEIIAAPFIGEETGGNYGDFAFGTTQQSELNVLPIQLISFTAIPENQKAQTQWSTHSETNNAFFTVERSADARVFHEIGKVTGAGTSHTMQHYSLTDSKPLPNVSYYRLKQTDFDGQYTYSDIQAVSFKETSDFSLDLTYRDENDLSLVYKSVSPYILVEIFDILGKRVFTEVAENYGGRSVLNPNLGRGAYVVRISAGDKSDTGKIVW